MGNVIGITIGTDGLLGRCFDSTAKQVRLGCDLEENVRTLRDEFDALRAKMNDVINRVRREESPEMRQLDLVANWILKVRNLEENITALIQNCTEEIPSSVDGNIDRTVGLGTSFGCCANISCKRRKLDKKVAQKLREVANLKTREFASVVCGVAPDPLPKRNIERTIGLKTSIVRVLEHINNDQVRIIGLYGMGGVGKTTLLTEINNKLCDGTHGFDLVIWVKVSDNSTIENIQHEIGRKIGYPATWEKKSQAEKAGGIFTVLEAKSFVLLLDDIRVHFDLKDVGIPLSSTRKMSKVIFTTRSLEVCAQMEAQRKVNVKCLEKVEAWELFKSKVGDHTLNRHPRILKLAKLVAKECDGLPLALIIVGKAMASKSTPQEWSRDLSVLQTNAAQFKDLEDKVFGLLKLSYDNLPNDIARNCFLYCILFPGDFQIPKKKLINYWFGEGFVEDPDLSYNKIGKNLEGYSIIGTLVNASLLEDDENGGVKMHDVIRDMALWLASDCGKTIGKYWVEARAELTEVPSVILNEGVERVSLASNSITSLPHVLPCHNLLTLLLNDNILNMISHGFFRNMRNLGVLDLSGNEGITKLPKDIVLLISLQYLNLAGTGITKLPSGLDNLVRLKYIDLTHTRNLLREKQPQLSLNKIESLRVVKMFGCALPFSSILDSSLLQNMLLSITIRSERSLYEFSKSLKGDTCIYRMGFSHIERLPHKLVVHITRRAKTERLEITDCEFDTTPLRYTDSELTGIKWKLRSVFIVRCSKVQNLTWLSFAKSLTFLLVAHCKEIDAILTDEIVSNPFDSLEEMYLVDLPELHYVSSVKLQSSASASTSTSEPTADVKLRSLRFIGVEDCPKLRNVSVEGSSETTFIVQGSADWWDALPEKPAATNWITPDIKEGDKKKFKSSSSASASTSTSVPYPDTHLPNFFSYD